MNSDNIPLQLEEQLLEGINFLSQREDGKYRTRTISTLFYLRSTGLDVSIPKIPPRVYKIIKHSFEDMLFICERIDWQNELKIKGELSRDAWRLMTNLDIEYFFIVTRSAMDGISQLIGAISNKSDQLPNSYNELKNKLNKYASRMNPRIYSLVKNDPWFEIIKSLRDSFIHADNRLISSALNGDRATFTTEKRDDYLKERIPPALWLNENLIAFEYLAAAIVAHLIYLVETIADSCVEGANKILIGSIHTDENSAYELQKTWMLKLIQANQAIETPKK